MQSFKILLADDDPEDRAIIQDALEILHAGDVIEFAENGERALQLLSAHHQNGSLPALVVLDLNMPRMNGTLTLEYIKKDDRFKLLPVVIYSTSINPLEKEKCMELGAHSYITKPISFKESLETARKLLQFCQANVSV